MRKTDVQLLQEVLDEIAWDPRLADAQIGVSVHDGVVTLAGTASSWTNKLAAAEAAHRVAGVLDVANEVGVALPAISHTDASLAGAIRHSLQWDVTVPDDRISSTVADGFVVLEGEVENFAQKDDAARAVRNLRGVVAVDNRIVVKPPEVTPEQLRAAIHEALERRAAEDLTLVKLDVQGARVVVHGDVHSWSERAAIMKAITETRGVQSVEDQMRFA
jgi:osmotically-inducible protein OsmY